MVMWIVSPTSAPISRNSSLMVKRRITMEIKIRQMLITRIRPGIMASIKYISLIPERFTLRVVFKAYPSSPEKS